MRQHIVGRRDFLRLGTAGAALAALGACRLSAADGIGAAGAAAIPGGLPAAALTANGDRPNIIFINTDDLDMASVPTMPKLKSLLTDQGTSFTNFFLTVSLCCPSRSTFLRGQFAHNTQVLTNGGDNGGYERVHALGIEQSTIATWLQAAGYHTGMMGKYLNGYPKSASDTTVPPGWNEWYGAVGSGGYSEFNYQLNENGTLVSYGKDPKDYLTDVLAGKATDFIAKAAPGSQPFFLYVATFAPHQPATPAPRYADAFPDAKAPRPPSYNEGDVSDKPQWVRQLPPLSDAEQANLDGLYRKRIQTLQSVDDLIERVIGALQMAGALDNTYIVFSSDNGFHLGEHRETAGKQAPYEENIRVPMIVRGPGVAAGKTVDALVGNVDFAPTFAAWGGATVPDFVDGRSFAPLIGNGTPADWRQAFLIEHFAETGSNGKGKGNGKKNTTKAAKNAKATPAASAAPVVAPKGNGSKGIPEFHGMRAKDYVYVEYVTNERELYDLTADPDELRNIAGTADPALLGQLSAQLADLTKGAGATLRTVEQQAVPTLH